MKIKKNIAVSDTGFLFNPSTGDSYSVNPVGLEMLRLMKEEKEDSLIVDHIQNNYLIARDTIEKDLYDFKNMLESYKLIQ
jgi:Coenzyme PQQ synthesis protein D (PqqD)